MTSGCGVSESRTPPLAFVILVLPSKFFSRKGLLCFKSSLWEIELLGNMLSNGTSLTFGIPPPKSSFLGSISFSPLLLVSFICDWFADEVFCKVWLVKFAFNSWVTFSATWLANASKKSGWFSESVIFEPSNFVEVSWTFVKFFLWVLPNKLFRSFSEVFVMGCLARLFASCKLFMKFLLSWILSLIAECTTSTISSSIVTFISELGFFSPSVREVFIVSAGVLSLSITSLECGSSLKMVSICFTGLLPFVKYFRWCLICFSFCGNLWCVTGISTKLWFLFMKICRPPSNGFWMRSESFPFSTLFSSSGSSFICRM